MISATSAIALLIVALMGAVISDINCSLAAAEAALKAITWAEIAQAVANTQDTVQAKLLEQAKAAILALKGGATHA